MEKLALVTIPMIALGLWILLAFALGFIVRGYLVPRSDKVAEGLELVKPKMQPTDLVDGAYYRFSKTSGRSQADTYRYSEAQTLKHHKETYLFHRGPTDDYVCISAENVQFLELA